MRIEELWFSPAPAAAVGRALLTPASWLYALGWQAYAQIYRLGLKRPQEPFRPVVCVGNLVVGGSGKTPATLSIARTLKEMGESVVLSLSGYGSPRSEAAALAPEGPLDAVEWGDEPAMVRWLMPETPMIVGRRRVLAAQLAAEHCPGGILLMDDGFQHLPLRKHVTLVIDSSDPANSRCLPAGPYREPRRNRSKADLVIGERFGLVRGLLRFIDPSGTPVDFPQTATMLCALGTPDNFYDELRKSGTNVIHQVRLPDHDPLTAGNLFVGLDRNTALVVTAKDWVKLRVRPDLDGWKVLIALQDAVIHPEEQFRFWLGEHVALARNP